MKVKKKMKFNKPRLISSKRGIVVKGEWKAVNLDPSLFAKDGPDGLDGLDGLVCFEELTDYTLVEPKKALTVQEHTETTSKKKKKRKASETETEEQDVEEKPDKKKKKWQKKNRQDDEPQDESVLEELEEDEQDSEDEISQDETPETQHKTPRKKKQQRKKKKKKKKKALPDDAEAQSEPSVAAQSQKKTKSWSRPALVGSEGPGTDVSAWKDLFVPEPVLKALSVLGYSAPTPIQALALPPAIRDRLDILGAAET
ncbi:hypothetical protein M9458_035462, partial [Cirrhinus mrigala]